MNTIIIPTYCPVLDVKNKLGRCLSSIAHHTSEQFQLVVVEQGDKLAEHFVIDELESTFFLDNRPVCSELRYAWSKSPLGFARAVNIGVKLADGDYLFIVNNDIEVPWDWDKKLIEVYKELPHGYGVLCPVDVPTNSPRRLILDVGWWSCVLISRSTWDKVGALDDKLLNYRFHDQDWNIRCRKMGMDVAGTQTVLVKHDEASTYRHMQSGVDESGERAEMIRRYGVAHFHEWVQRNQPS